jgi:hypothetical protein
MTKPKTELEIMLARDLTSPAGYKLARVQLSEDALLAIDNAVAGARTIQTIDDDMGLTHAIDTVAVVVQVIGEIEAARKAVKQPFLDAERAIDACPKKHLEPLRREEQRLKFEIGRFEGERRREQLAEKARNDKLAEELIRSAQTAPNPEQKEAYEQASLEAHVAAQHAVKTVAGAQIRPTYEARLVDFKKVAATNEHLLVHELSKSAVADMIRAMSPNGEQLDPECIPGIILIPKTTVGVFKHS